MKPSGSTWRTIAFLLCMLGLYSCTKTELVPFEQESNNTIRSYQITNVSDSIYGAIDNQANTITVYIPYYLGIDYLVPEIQLDEGATLLDADGNAINLDGGVQPVPMDTTGYVYSVVGQDKNIRQYTLVIKIAPHPDPLKAGYQLASPGSTEIDYQTSIEKTVYGRLELFGNFGSTSGNAQFKLTNRRTKEVFTDLLSVYQVNPGANYYTMQVDISAEADSGYYDVEMQHQGRTTQLPPLHLIYGKAKFSNLASTSAYAPGDTVTFSVLGHNIDNNRNGSIIGLERVYLKFTKSGFTFGGSYPETFPDNLFGQELEMKIVSVNRTEVKVLFPDVPEGAVGSYRYSFTMDLPGIGFFFDFNDETGWGKDNMLATTGLLFTINPKK